jgi:hypothetical protein
MLAVLFDSRVRCNLHSAPDPLSPYAERLIRARYLRLAGKQVPLSFRRPLCTSVCQLDNDQCYLQYFTDCPYSDQTRVERLDSGEFNL